MNEIEEFMYTVKSERTKELYKEYLKYFEKFSGICVTKLLTMKPKEIENILIKYVIFMRDRKLSNSSIKGRISPLIVFLELNDILVNKRKIKKYYGEEKKTVRDEAYTTEDIAKMLSVAKLRVKVMILVYSSTGIRRDAIIDLKLKHLEKIPEYNLYKVTVYENSKEEYVTFTTPEAANMIDLYLKHREEAGETINKESYLVRNDYDYFVKDVSRNPKPVTSWNLNTLFRQLLLKIGLRAQNKSKYSRHEKPIFHALRKFHSSQLVESNLKTELRWLLEGHNLRANDSSYVRVSEKRLLEEYLRAVNNLTINEENRLKIKVEELTKKQDDIELIKAAHEKYKEEMNTKMDKIIAAMQKNPKLSRIKPEVLKRKIH
jgi:integrase